MIKYYLAVTIGTGSAQDLYRPKIAEYRCNWTAVYSSPDQKSSIVAVNATDEVIAKIALDTEITYLGDDKEVMTSAEFQRLCPNGTVMVYA